MRTNLGKDNLVKTIFKFSIPSILTMWIYSLYTIVDGMFIGKFLGSKEIAAVNIVMPYVNFSFALGIMIAIGSGTMIAVKLGEGKEKEVERIYSIALETLLLLGMGLGVLGVFFPETVVKFLGANNIILTPAKTYLFVISFFTLFYLMAYGFEIFIRIDGNPSYSMFCNLGGAIMNIVLDYVFIVHFHWGIEGAALATGMAQFTTSFMLWYYLRFRATKFKFRFMKLDFKMVKSILFKGSPEFLTEVATGIVIMAFNIKIMNIIGEKGVSTFGIIGYISTLVTMTMIGFSQGLQPIISYNYGACEFEKIKKTLKIGIGTVFVLGIGFYSLVNLFASDIISIFVKNDVILYEITKEAITIYSFTYILMGLNIIIGAYFTAIENPKVSVVLSVLRGIIIINTLLYIFPTMFNSRGIWMSAPVNEMLTLVFSIIFFSTIGMREIEV